jgi:putative ABC transport system permease protein
VLTLALGIGANSAIFTVVNAVLLRPFPLSLGGSSGAPLGYQPEEELRSGAGLHPAVWRLARAEPILCRALAYYHFENFTYLGGDAPERVAGVRASFEFWQVLRVQPGLGRAYDAGEDRPGVPPVAGISHGLCQRRFGGDPAVLGRPLALADKPYTIIGFMPAGFVFPRESEIWLASSFDPKWFPRADRFLNVVARLKPGVQVETDGDWDVAIIRLQDQIVGAGVRLALIVLLIACVNLLIARAASRQKEIAVRMAIGAGRGRLVRQFLVENLVLVLLGGGLGLLGVTEASMAAAAGYPF